MRIISKKALRDYWERHPESKEPLRAWYGDVAQADWATPANVIERYPKASLVGRDRVVFRVRHNDYRIVVRIFYLRRTVFITFCRPPQGI